jgi:transposase
MPEIVGYRAQYREKEYLQDVFVNKNMSAKQIAKENNVSYKLVNVWLIKYGFILRTPETKVP